MRDNEMVRKHEMVKSEERMRRAMLDTEEENGYHSPLAFVI